MPRDARDAGDLPLGGVVAQQGPNGGLQMWLQDVQPVGSLENKGAKVTSCCQSPIYDGAAISASDAGDQVEQFDPATSGALWVATGEQ